MPRHVNEHEAANKIETAILRVFEEGELHTCDIGGAASTNEFADAIIDKMN